MDEETWRTAADVVAGLLVLWAAASAPDRRDRVMVLGVAVCWFLGSAVPELVAVQRGALTVLLLVAGRGHGRRRAPELLVVVLLGALMSLPALPPVVAAGVFAGVAVALRRTPGPRAAAAARVGLLLAAVETAVMVSNVVGGRWPVVAALAYTAAVPVACWIVVTPSWWTQRVRQEAPTDGQVAADPFAAITLVLRDALHDGALVVEPIDSPGAAAGRAGTDRMSVEVRGAPWATVGASRGVLSDAAVRAAVRESLVLVGEQAALRIRLGVLAEDLMASRSRLLDAADHEREEWGPLVERVVQRPLDDVAHELRTWPDLADELHAAAADVEAILRGYPPVPLGEGGVVRALQTVGARLPVRVLRDIDPGFRAPGPVETALYAVAAEAVTNAVKHSRGTVVRIRLEQRRGTALLVVVDDGVGGARMDGSGLRALRLRVEARGGQLWVGDAEPRGTTVTATVPTGAPVGAG